MGFGQAVESGYVRTAWSQGLGSLLCDHTFSEQLENGGGHLLLYLGRKINLAFVELEFVGIGKHRLHFLDVVSFV